MNFLILLAVVGAAAYRLTSPEDRARYLELTKAFITEVRVVANLPRPEYDAFRAALRVRTRHVVVLHAMVAVQTAVVVGMLFGATPMGDSSTLLDWGANLGLRTTNGEWWRLVTAAFLHGGPLQLLFDAAVLIQLGAVVERLAGPFTVAAVYVSAGALAGLVHISAHPVAIGLSTSAAIFGIYGLLLGCLAWQTLRRTRAAAPPDAAETGPQKIIIPVTAMKRLGMMAVMFIICSAVNGLAGTAEFTGLCVGVAFGLVLGPRVQESTPRLRSVALAIGATAVIGVACALPLRNIADAKPELARVIAIEERTAATYKAAFERFRRGRMTAEALAKLAESTIVPELQDADDRLAALVHVPPEHQPLVANAREFLRLRSGSWRARADAIRKTNKDLRELPQGAGDASWRIGAEARFRSNMAATGHAEGAERASLEAFERVRQGTPTQY